MRKLLTTIVMATIMIVCATIVLGQAAITNDYIAYSSKESGIWEIRAMNPNTSESELLLSVGGSRIWGGAFSPDRTRFAYSSNIDGSYDIYIFELDGSGVTTKITTDGTQNFMPRWIDQESLIFVTGYSNYEIDRIHSNGSDRTCLTCELSGSYTMPVMSPDGLRIAYTDGSIAYVADFPGFENRCELSSTESGYKMAYDWSDIGRIAFQSTSPSQVYTAEDCRVNLDTLSPNDATDNEPFFSSDGQWIAFQSVQEGLADVSIMEANGISSSRLQLTLDGTIEVLDWGGSYGSTIYLPYTLDGECDSNFYEQPVAIENYELLKGGNFAFKIPDGIRDLEVSFDGYLTESWGFNGYEVNDDSGFVIIWVTGGDIPAGDNELFGLRFKTERECRTNFIIPWDSALSDDPVRKTFVVLEDFEKAYPIIDSLNNFTEILGYEPGDVTDDGNVDLADITAMIDHVYITKAPLCIRNAGLLNSDLFIDLADITRLIDHIYISKTPLLCDYSSAPPVSKLNVDVGVFSMYRDGVTTISIMTADDLRGLHVELVGEGDAIPISANPERLDIVYGQEGNSISIGVLDLDGSEMIRKGESTVLTLQGEYEIVSALVVTKDFSNMELLINAKPGDALPDEFALYQNYPNPFNPTTTIQFDMPVASNYQMTIYNIAGQVVETQNGHSEAGTVQFEWDASDKASGIYFYRLQVGDMVETKKMVLLK